MEEIFFCMHKGRVPPSGPLGSTNIPGNGVPGCPIKEMHFAGGGARPGRRVLSLLQDHQVAPTSLEAVALAVRSRRYTLPVGKSSRLLHDQETRLKKIGIFLHALHKGPVPPSGPSGCTNIPGSGGSCCPIKEMHFAGGGARPGVAAYSAPHEFIWCGY
ncbi:Uncharacterized protein Fot_23380 [Forsythia ovata]|uniref:Uncharacterized protein n=1 Tax=Forsythia ovata TaxID=205694 RepID=A0ABD1V0E8_9LAMI